MPNCSRCGTWFAAGRGPGRPRTRCDRCRSNLARIDGTVWRKLRLQVLKEQPICAVEGCGRPSTEVDHIVPLARGGPGLDRRNLQGMCKSHNSAKGARTGIEARKPVRRHWVL